MSESQPLGPASREAVKNADFLKNVRFSPGPFDPRDLESGLGDKLLEKQTGSARKQKLPGRLLKKRTESAGKQEAPGWEQARLGGTVVARIGLVLSLAFVLTYLLLMVLGHRIF